MAIGTPSAVLVSPSSPADPELYSKPDDAWEAVNHAHDEPGETEWMVDTLKRFHEACANSGTYEYPLLSADADSEEGIQ